MADEQQTPPNPDVPSTGTGTTSLEPVANDPNAGRKAIIAKHNLLSQAEREGDVEEHPSMAALQGQMAADQESDPVTRLNQEWADQVARETAASDAAAAGTQQGAVPAQQVDTPAQGDTVRIKVYGQEMELPAADVEAEGGVAAVQKRLGAEFQFREAANLARIAKAANEEAQRKLADIERREQALAQAQQAAPTPTEQQPILPSGVSASDSVAIEKIVDDLYSGDPAKAREAIAEVMRAKRDAPEQSVEHVVEKVLAKTQADAAKAELQRANEAKAEADRQDIAATNKLMAEKYGAILDNPLHLEGARGMFTKAFADPRNAGRSRLEIADEVGQQVLGMVGGGTPEQVEAPAEIAARTHLKRRLPVPSEASGRVPTQAAQPAFPVKPSDVVAMLRHSRGLPPLV